MTFYVINVDAFFKLGITTNLKERLTAYKTHSPRWSGEVVFKYDHLMSAEIEKHWTDQFAKKCVNGEWFALSKDDVDKIKDETAKLWPESRNVVVTTKRPREIETLVASDRRSWNRIGKTPPPNEMKPILIRLGNQHGPSKTYVVTGYRSGDSYFTSDSTKLDHPVDWANIPSVVPLSIPD